MITIEHVGTNQISPSTNFNGQGIVRIGPWSWISHECYIEAHVHNFEEDDWPVMEYPQTLVIEGQVYIAPRVIILGKCHHIAEGVLIGAGSVVTKNIEVPWTKWAGNPARMIGVRKQVNTTWV
jgi:putative colanic acid biosynthesis acetyltransferase WcaF